MRLNHGMIALILSATALAAGSAMTGCAGGLVVYDPYYHDYRRWSPEEDTFYVRWETETHRDHMDFRRRGPEDQREYWGWRHR